MEQHPIEGLMRTTLESIKSMVDVNTILGDPVETPDGKVIIPISRVTFGFAAGGTEYEMSDGADRQGGDKSQGGRDGGSAGQGSKELPFGGGSGAGISIQPVGFLIVGRDDMRLLPVDGQVILDRLIDMAPRVIDGLQNLVREKPARAGSEFEQEQASSQKERQPREPRERHTIQAHRLRPSGDDYTS